MSLTLYDACVPNYVRAMRALSGVLDKGAAYAAEKDVAEAVLIDARLYPDMWSLAEQVRAVANHGTRGPARLAGLPPPKFEGDDSGFAGLKARLAWATDYALGVDRAALAEAETREIVFPAGDTQRRLSGRDYFFAFSLPNFMFHATTAYAILRHNGVPLEKDDFIGRD